MQQSLDRQVTPNILIVDDVPANLQLLVEMLKKRGYKVRPVLGGKLAIQAAKNDSPDLILLDINMPEMNGYEVCEILKADEKLKEVPVIFISALNETMDKVKAFSVGGVDYVTKPFQFEEVNARVKTHLELQRQKQELRDNYEKLRELESLRDSLVHMIVHDIRNSLTGVSGFIELASGDQNSTGSVKEYLQRAMNSVQNLVEMISSLLDVSKMETGKMPLNLAECNLRDIAKDALEKIEHLKGTRRLFLNNPESSFIVKADPALLARVVQNLLGNALKFTPENGEIRINIESDKGGVRFSVTDTGPGIPPEYHQKIFEKFGQVEIQADKHKYSTGLGLTFCKLVIETHGGIIDVDSEMGKGSTFWFVLGNGSEAGKKPV